MRYLNSGWLVLIVLLGLSACGSNPIKGLEGQTAFTQIGLWSENGEHVTTNYGRRDFLPVNTEVRILDTNSEAIVFEPVAGGQQVQIVNIKGYTDKDIAGIYDRYFGSSKRDLSQFSQAERQAIQSGQVQEGMSKDAVLVARGYPPVHRTSSIENNTWTYWRSRFDTISVSFVNGKVSAVEN